MTECLHYYLLLRPPLNGYGKSGIKNDVSIKLSLPTWANCVGIRKEQNDAMMFAPWLNLCQEIDLLQSVGIQQVNKSLSS